jgi:hypothetical protein
MGIEDPNDTLGIMSGLYNEQYGMTDKRGGNVDTLTGEFVPTKTFFDKQGQRSAKQNEARLKAVQTKGAASAGGVRSILKGQVNPPAQGATILGGQNTAVKTLLGV